MKATVVITRYKESNALLHETLYSLSKQINCVLEVLMLEQFYDKDTEELCAHLNSSCKHHFQYEMIQPVSLSYARNYGTKKASNDVILYIEPDAIASPNRAETIIQCFDQHPQGGIAGTKIKPKRNGKRNIFTYCSFFVSEYSMLDMGDEVSIAGKVTGASFALHKGRLGKEAYFDENLGRKDGNLMGGEETDLCKRAQAQGRDVLYIGTTYVFHQVMPERLKYGWIAKRVFRGGYARAITKTAPEPRKIKRSFVDYLLLPFYLLFYFTGFAYGKFFKK